MEPYTIVYYRNTNLEGTVLAVKDTDFGKRYQVCWTNITNNNRRQNEQQPTT